MTDYLTFYRGRRVMITGGLGFIGSNLARVVADLGADVLLVDSLIPDHGGNLFNIAGIEDRVRLNIADIRTATTINALVQGREVIFNLAGQVSHIDSMRDPHTDLEINCHSQLTILEACRHNNPGVKVVFASTRQVYGRPDTLPVSEPCDAFLRAGASDACNGEVCSVGGSEPISHRALTSLLLEVAGTGRVRYVDWPAERKATDIGSFYSDSTRIRATTGWEAHIGLREGLARTIAFYREHYDRYVENAGRPATLASRCASRSWRCARVKTGRRSTRRSGAWSTAAGSSSAPRSRRSRPSSPWRAGRGTPSASTRAPTR